MNNINPVALAIIALFGIIGYLVAGTTGCLIGIAISLGVSLFFSVFRFE